MEFVELLRGHLAHLLEIPAEEIGEDTVLADHPNWDSLTIVSLVAILIDEKRGSPDPKLFEQVVTFSDLVRIVMPR